MLDVLQENLLLGTMILHEPERLLRLFDRAITVVQTNLIEHHDSRFLMTVKKSCHARIHELPRCAELQKPTISSIRAADINQLMQVPGTVTRTGQVKMLQTHRSYKCLKCDHEFQLEADVEQRHVMALPPECPAQLARPCHGTKFELIEGSEVCRDYQEVRIQEQVHRLSVGSIPRSITVVLQDELVDTCKVSSTRPSRGHHVVITCSHHM